MPQGPKPPMAVAASANKRPIKDAKKTLVGVAPPPGEVQKALEKAEMERAEKTDANASPPVPKTAPLGGGGFKNALEEMAKRKADLAKTQRSEPPPMTSRTGSLSPGAQKDSKPAPPLPAKKPSVAPPITAKMDAKPTSTTAKMPSKPPVPIPPPPVALQLPIVDAYAPMSLPLPPNLPDAAGPAPRTGPPAPLTRPMTGPPLMPQPIMPVAPTTRGLGEYAAPPPPVALSSAQVRAAMGSQPGIPDLTQRSYSAWSSEPALAASTAVEEADVPERDLFDELPPDPVEASGQLSYQVFRPADLKKPRAPSRVDMEAFAPKTSTNAKIGMAVAGGVIVLLTLIIIVLGSADDPPPSLAPATPPVTAAPFPTYTTPTIATTSMLPVVTSDPIDPPPPVTTAPPAATAPKTRPKATGSAKNATPPPNPYGGTPPSVLKPPKK